MQINMTRQTCSRSRVSLPIIRIPILSHVISPWMAHATTKLPPISLPLSTPAGRDSSSKSNIHEIYEDLVVLFGWDLKSLWRKTHRKRCDALLRAANSKMP
ncbi:hypothetical protein C8R48DRAFT_736851 [Suillus tomentosus]|nr:hypothetical protein C8R48DRAFT_736851 [Suillus tomentosus]